MEITQRQKIIFKTIVEEFTRCAEPVGSKTLMELLDFPVSSATIRNEMATLEKLGLLEKTHTSSGRIPSQKGYRYYVEHLMKADLDVSTKNALQQVFSERHYSLEEVVQKSCDILSHMTNLTSVVLGPDSRHQTLQHVQLIPINNQSAVAIIVTDQGHTENKVFQFGTDVSMQDIQNCTDLLNDQLVGTPIENVVDKMKEIEPMMAAKLVRHEVLFEAFVSAFMRFATEKVAVSGRSNMLYQPEFSDINKLKQMMRILENGNLFHQWTDQEGNVAIQIGERNELLQIGDCSVLTTKFHYNSDEEGQLMVVGPNRMQYSKVVALMDYMSNVIEDVFGTDKNEEVVEETTEEKKEPSSDEIIEGLKAELDKAKNDVARAYADTENMKKRLQKDADTARKYRFQQPATEILPILDSMEMALKVQTEDEVIKNYVKGFEMIHKQLKGVLEKEGVQEIDVADKPFDHNTMQALMQEKKEGVESGMVIEVLQKGYMLKDRILRPALVKVSE